MPRAKTKQLVSLILYRHDVFKQGRGNELLVREIQEELLYEYGRKTTRAHIRRLIRNQEHKGIIEREFHYLHTGLHGDKGQANSYTVKNILGVFDLFLSGKDLQAMKEARQKEKAIKAGMPLDCFKPGYTPSLAYIEKYSPFYKAATQADLGPKYPSGDIRNYERQKRVNAIMSALKRKRQQAEKDALARS